MDFILEFIMTIILEGSMELVTVKKVPIVIRVLAAVLLLVFYLGFVGYLFYIGITEERCMIIGIAVFLCVFIVVAVIKEYKEIKG